MGVHVRNLALAYWKFGIFPTYFYAKPLLLGSDQETCTNFN
jgi:hypothetical protein